LATSTSAGPRRIGGRGFGRSTNGSVASNEGRPSRSPDRRHLSAHNRDVCASALLAHEPAAALTHCPWVNTHMNSAPTSENAKPQVSRTPEPLLLEGSSTATLGRAGL